MAPDDPTLPAVPHLLGPDAPDVVRAALGAAGGRLEGLRPAQVLYQPGHSLTVRFVARVAWHGGEPRDETILAGTTAEGAPAGTLPLRAGDLEVGVWRYPFDPGLPGLATAVHADRVAALLDGALGAAPSLAVRTYRPGRRAVVEAADPTTGRRAFLKVVRPAEVERMVAVHERLVGHLPVPAVLAADHEAGVVALEALDGQPLRAVLRDATARRPDPAEVLVLLDALRGVALPAVPRRRLSALPAAQGHLQLLGTVLPSAAARVARLGERLAVFEDRLPPTGAEPAPTVHGDFHDAQVLVRDGLVEGVVDLDDAGEGEPLDDLATLLGHLHTVALGDPGARARVSAWANAVRLEVVGEVDPVGLDARVAAVAVGLATGPFRVQADGWADQTAERLALAERWLTRAERGTGRSGAAGLGERTLSRAS